MTEPTTAKIRKRHNRQLEWLAEVGSLISKDTQTIGILLDRLEEKQTRHDLTRAMFKDARNKMYEAEQQLKEISEFVDNEAGLCVQCLAVQHILNRNKPKMPPKRVIDEDVHPIIAIREWWWKVRYARTIKKISELPDKWRGSKLMNVSGIQMQIHSSKDKEECADELEAIIKGGD